MKTCFVVQGFGPKTDYTDGRILNLDASYEVIKQAVVDSGLACIRADEIVHSGTIDIPMYQQLLRADLVIADLSTYNVNAAFELGVRYGLRPYATIVVAEELFKSPFDVNHIVIRRYKHLGEDIGRREAQRFQDDLKNVIATIITKANTDSPVYSMLAGLTPPVEAVLAGLQATAAVQQAVPPAASPVVPPAVPPAAASFAATRTPMPMTMTSPSPSPSSSSSAGRSATDTGSASSATASAAIDIATAEEVIQSSYDAATNSEGQMTGRNWLDQAQSAMKRGDFVSAKIAWSALRKINPNDNHISQQLALATYKAKQPNIEQALADARQLLLELSPATTNDPETMGLWGAVHKRLWELHHQFDDLSAAIAAYERGYLLKQDHYNGINLAFLLNLRAVKFAEQGERNEAIADDVQARRVRRDVLSNGAQLIASDETCKEATHDDADDEVSEKRYWVVATLWEAALGIGDSAAVAQWDATAHALKVPQWMQDTREEQGQHLLALQAQLAGLLEAG